MRSSELLDNFLEILKGPGGSDLFLLIFNKPYYPLDQRKLTNEFFILLKPWLKDLPGFLSWNLSLKELQEKINKKTNQKTRELILRIIYSLLIESNRRPYQKVIAQTQKLPETIIDYLLEKHLHFEILKVLSSNESLKHHQFQILFDHKRSFELYPFLARNPSFPQNLIYRLIQLKNSTVSESLLYNPTLSSTQCLRILSNHPKDYYLLLVLLEKKNLPDEKSFWKIVDEALRNEITKESVELRLFFRNQSFPDHILRKQRRFLKLQMLEKNTSHRELINSVEARISKKPGAKNKLSKFF